MSPKPVGENKWEQFKVPKKDCRAKTIISLRLDKDLVEECEKLASENEVSRTHVIRSMIKHILIGMGRY